MIFNTTYTNEEYTNTARHVVGKSYSFLERIKKKGIGSGRFLIHKVSKQFNFKTDVFSELNYANIELRPKGIIVHIAHQRERYAWVIPYYKLHFYNTEYYSIHGDGIFIQFRKNKHYRNNKLFLEKIQDLKIDHLQLTYYDR